MKDDTRDEIESRIEELNLKNELNKRLNRVHRELTKNTFINGYLTYSKLHSAIREIEYYYMDKIEKLEDEINDGNLQDNS